MVMLFLAACGGGPAASPTATGVAPASGAASGVAETANPSAAPTSSPTGTSVTVDTIVETVANDLSVRQQPGLYGERLGIAPVGMLAWVVEGPVAVDGYQWFLLTGAPEDAGVPSACLRLANGRDVDCLNWIGWAAGETPSGERWLQRVAIECPAGRDVATYLSLSPHERLYCAGADEWELTVYVPPLVGGRGCLPVWVTDPGWMTGECTFTFPQPVKRQFDEDTDLQMFTPPRLNTCGDSGACWWDEFKGEWVLVTGNMDHRVARTCRPVLAGALEDREAGPPPDTDLVVHQCRLHFVVSSVRPGTAPASAAVTFRLILRGPVPDDASFAIQDGVADGPQHAIYLCSYYGGWPACGRGEAYEDVWTGAPGSRLSYTIWRELDTDGRREVLKRGELVVGPTDQVTSVTYQF